MPLCLSLQNGTTINNLFFVSDDFAHVYICVCTVAVCMNNFDNIPSILHLVAMLVLFYK